MENSTSELRSLYSKLTVEQLQQKLKKLNCTYKISWRKSSYLDALCLNPIESVIGVLKSNEWKIMLKELNLSTEGRKHSLQKRILDNFCAPSKKYLKKISSNLPRVRLIPSLKCLGWILLR